MLGKLVIAIAAGTVLTAAGAALAHFSQDGTQAVSASFSAGRERADVRTCTGADGSYEIVRGRYSGQSASPHPTLNGSIVLTIRSVYNRSEGLGWIRGSLKIRGSEHPTQARLVGTLTWGSSDTRVVDGFVEGPAGGHGAKLYGNFTASFSPLGGFAEGKIGEGGANIALLAGRECKPPATQLKAKGRIAVLSSSLIAIRRGGSKLVTCQIRAGVSPSTNRLRVGDTVEMSCGLVDSQMTLLKVEKKGRDHDKKDDDDDED